MAKIRPLFLFATMTACVASVTFATHAQPRFEHFDATLSGPQIELKFKRLREAREIPIDRALEWVYQFSGADSQKLEALSVRLVRDGFRIASLQTTDRETILRVARSEHLSPPSLEHRGRELAKLAAISGARYDGADAPR